MHIYVDCKLFWLFSKDMDSKLCLRVMEKLSDSQVAYDEISCGEMVQFCLEHRSCLAWENEDLAVIGERFNISVSIMKLHKLSFFET